MSYTVKYKGYLALVSSIKGKLHGVVNLQHGAIAFDGTTFKELIMNMDLAIQKAIDNYGVAK